MLNRRQAIGSLATGIAGGLSVLGAACARQPASNAIPNYRYGISLAGGAFGSKTQGYSNETPGVYGMDYTYPTRATANYFVGHSVGLFRIPFRWERLQRELGQSLDATELTLLSTAVNSVGRAGGRVLLDCHNYGRYHLLVDGVARAVRIDESVQGSTLVSRAAFADLWRQLATHFQESQFVVGYGLMNEPHDMGQSDWKAISQTAADAIREVDQKTHLMVAGDEWSNAERFEDFNGSKAWINDPADRVVYEAHCYFDHDSAGKYRRSFDDELADDPALLSRGRQRVTPFLNWCRRNQVAGLIGEVGIPSDSRWQPLMSGLLDAVAEFDFPVCYWAAGEWWGDYPLSVQPTNFNRAPRPQLQLFLNHLQANG